MKKHFVAVAVISALVWSLPLAAQAQTYGGFYGGYGDNGFLNRALTLRKSKRKARPSKRVVRKKQVRRSNRSYRRSRR